MPAISQTTHILSFSSSSSSSAVTIIVVFALSLFPMVLAERESSRILRLPSENSKMTPWSCPVKCFRASPVCGEDGVTYWCGCAEAECAGTKVAKLGFCEVGSGGSTPLPLQALLLVHIVWHIVIGFSVLFGLF
ncbi:uncharacterized protein LOC114751278 [Neltuma alba]|uniref:uncharacterized protein LOC114751278 n=1 Tax=Neltuma alba TaxID=207710 RepID=UPI0010A32570|nr:uncharacterized protein LOC114751278 [Prosopis alba]